MSYLQEDTDMALSGRQAPPAVPQITFLYKLVPGVADRSFGLNVARMAHLPATVVDRAAEQAAHLEQLTLDRARYVILLAQSTFGLQSMKLFSCVDNGFLQHFV